MPYRPVTRRTRAPVRTTGYTLLLRHQALVRARASHSRRNGSSLPTFLSIVGMALVAVFAASSMVTGATAVGVVDTLESDLPEPEQLEELDFAQPTKIYERTGKLELARFMAERRTVLEYEDIPPMVLDATTSAEDRTFWENEGIDPAAIGAAIVENLSGESNRGASTITQQLVRARLLPEEYMQPGADRYIRKAKELLQAYRLTEAFPGEEGKRRIITAYLNQIYYGHQAYGYAAAAEVYFGITDMRKLTPAQAALLAALAKSPSTLDPFLYAKEDKEGRLVVPQDSPPVVRRNYVLDGMRNARWTTLSNREFDKAAKEPVVLAKNGPMIFRAPHFVWQVKRELDAILAEQEPVETGGYTVITSLDYNAQALAERYITAAAVLPNINADARDRFIRRNKLQEDRFWINRLLNRDLHNGGIVALDYQSGDILAYVGSAGYYRESGKKPEFDPQYDVVGTGYRQPGSAWKPVVYASAFEERRLTAGSLLLDITTEFGRDSRTNKIWSPSNADNLERGPLTVRTALQYSLNIPAIRAMQRVGPEAVGVYAERLGIRFPSGRQGFEQAGLAGAIGTVEVRLLDLVSAYGTLGNNGVRVAPRTVLKVIAPDGQVVYDAGKPEGEQAISPESAYLVTDILAGNTNPAENRIWGSMFHIDNGPSGERRPAALKTGTTNDTRDLSTYGFLPRPQGDKGVALAVGVWMGNSDHSQPQGDEYTFAIDGPARVWHAFMREYSRGWPAPDFQRPDALVEATIDSWSGGAPGPWTRDTRSEWFIPGTEPNSPTAVDRPGLLYRRACGSWRVDPLQAELGPSEWDPSVQDWISRAQRGQRVTGEHGTSTAYQWGQSTWGGELAGSCRSRFTFRSSGGGNDSNNDNDSNNNGNNNGNNDGGDND